MAKPYRKDPTEYKSEYAGTCVRESKPFSAGLPVEVTNIGELWN